MRSSTRIRRALVVLARGGSPLLAALALLLGLAGLRPAALGAAPPASGIAGAAWTWGNNTSGELGDGSSQSYRASPGAVGGLGGVGSIAVGDLHNLTVRTDGTVMAWGYNGGGQIGDGTSGNVRATPVAVSGLSNVRRVAAGQAHSLALKADGTLWAWGDNTYGQLGTGTTARQLTPVPVTGLSGIVAIAAGYYHSLAIRSDGTVWAWGRHDRGQLATTGGTLCGTVACSPTPLHIGELSRVRAVAAGQWHSLAIKADGTLWTWGDNSAGQLGDPNYGAPRATPLPVGGLGAIAAVAAGANHTLAVQADGQVWAWGDNTNGQLGDGTTLTPWPTPRLVAGLAGVTAVAGGAQHSVALKADGTVWAWGDNAAGQVSGAGSRQLTPRLVSGLGRAGLIAAGQCHTLAIDAAVSGHGWGYNGFGQLGNGTATVQEMSPVPVSGLTGPVAIVGGAYHSLALEAAGTLRAWGYNGFGQLGDGTIFDRASAVPVSGLIEVSAVAAGADHGLAVRGDGTVWGWGRNDFGQVGPGAAASQTTPFQVSGLAGVRAVAAGRDHSLALKVDGTVWAWGRGASGQLGLPCTIIPVNDCPSNSPPVQVRGPGGSGFLTDVTAISAGASHSLAVRADGTGWAWGYNNYGQVGNGSAGDYAPTPGQIVNLSGVTALAGGGWHTLALKADGLAWAWGYGEWGQVGNGTYDYRVLTPAQVGVLTGVTGIAAAGYGYHSLAMRADGTAWAWGYNGYGQVGDGTTTNRALPYHVSALAGVRTIGAGIAHNLAISLPAGPPPATATPTPTPSPTAPTATPTSTATPTPTATATPTSTTTATSTATATPSVTPSATPTGTATPTRTPTPTPTATTSVPAPAQVGVTAVPQGGGRLQVTLSARASNCTPNGQLQAVRVTAATNAIVEVNGQAVALPGPLPLGSGSAQLAFSVRRATAGQPTHVNLLVTDGCGDWPTFVGGGADAF
jgi:alpha-tubulin suppressor-like RCC1 family protein